MRDVLVNQTGTTEFGFKSVAKDFTKATLVVIKALLGFIENGTDVDDDITSIQNSRIASTFEV